MLIRQLRFLYLSVIVLVSFLEVEAQQLPENYDYSRSHLLIPTPHVGEDFKILKGKIHDNRQREETQGILGTRYKDTSSTTFKPLVPFDLETPYTLVYNQQVFFFEIDGEDDQAPMVVTSVYPSARQVPTNVLKWYIEFSKPVNPVKIYEHIQFINQDGKPINRSILHLGAPLLSPDGTLLTIWIEPGRQKRMLGPNQHLGSVFEKAQHYTLQIANTLKDARGLPIVASVNHSFTTIEPDRTKPSIAKWQIGNVKARTKQPLEILCGEQLDYGSLVDAFSVSYNGQSVDGQLKYDSKMNSISFIPEVEWKQGEYTVNVGHQLEDLAGNNLRYLFDRAVEEGQDKVELEVEALTFKSE